MEELYPDFFNDVFGPVMQPGSSSHTAGPCRLGYLAHSLLSEPLKKIKIILDTKGSFAGTFGHMNEDLGMLAGAYGLLPDDVRIFDIKTILEREHIEYAFEFTELKESSHANAVKFLLTDVEENEVSLVGNSIGGGMVETVEIMGTPCRLQGDKEVVVRDKAGKEYHIAPVLPVQSTGKRKPQLFKTFTQWIAVSKERNQGLAETAIDYEKDASGWSREEIRQYMRKLGSYMERQTDAVYEDDTNLLETPFSGYHFRQWQAYEERSIPILGDVIQRALHYAFGVQALTKGVKMVPGPMGTGGGYLYAALRAVKEECNRTGEDVLRGLFVAAGVGAICYTRTSPTGEVIGCAGECGVCSAMAAAGLTEMLEGTPEQVEAAASLALQASSGWPCDPIPGGENQPCLSRVVTAVVMAIVFSQLALSGRRGLLPFHEVVDAVGALGESMPTELKCTSCGGMCDTPTGRNCRDAFEEWRKK